MRRGRLENLPHGQGAVARYPDNGRDLVVHDQALSYHAGQRIQGSFRDRGGRYETLDLICSLAHFGLDSDSTPSNPPDAARGVMAGIRDQLARKLMDWDAMLQAANAQHDAWAAAARQPTWAARQAALAAVAPAKSPAHGGRFSPARAKSLEVARLLLSLSHSPTQRIFAAHETALQTEGLAQTAFALALYRAEHGQYPERLEELVPQYAAAVPRDRFIGGPLHYRRVGPGYLLYSVGENGNDDGGRRADDDGQPLAPQGADDIGLRTGLAPPSQP